MSAADDLRAARALIDTPEKWRKDNNSSFDSCCAIIATNRVSGGGLGGLYSGAWRALYDALPDAWKPRPDVLSTLHGGYVGDFNDDPATTHADILALFDRAIAAAEKTP